MSDDVLTVCVCVFPLLQGTIHPFRKTHRSLLGKLLQELRLVSSDQRVSESEAFVIPLLPPPLL